MEFTDSPYIHGTHPEEQRRLAKLNELLNRRSLGRLDLRGGEQVLDVGSGLGQFALDMAAVVGAGGRVVGVERSSEQIAAARARAVAAETSPDFREGDAHELPLAPGEWGTFDVAHARFILEHVDDPLAVVQAMARAVRPGGRVVLEDDDHDVLRLWPPPAGVESLWRAYIDVYERMGRNPYIGRQLVSLLHEAGAEPSGSDWLPFGSCAGADSFEPLVKNFIGILEGARERILEAGEMEAAQFEAAIESFRRWADRPDAALWYATCWAEGIVPAGGPAAVAQDAGAGQADLISPGGATPWSDRSPHLTSERSKLRLLVRSAEDLNSSLDLDTVFRRIADRVKALADCQLFCVLLWNESTMLLEHSYSTCYDELVEIDQSGAFPLGYGISGHVAAGRQPIRVANVGNDSRYVRYRHPEVEICSELAVPLVFRDRLVGVIDLESTSLDAFTEDHERLLVALGSQIAIALENARLYRRLFAEEQRLEQDLETARQIQRALLPVAPPVIEGLSVGAACAQARTLGGDFYDFLALGEDRQVFAVGDVAGKGTPAALYGAMTVGILRGHAVLNSSGPAAMLAELNQQLVRPEFDGRFVALGIGVIDRSERTLTVANAGLPSPILVRDGESSIIPVVGMPLGMFDDRVYEERRIDLKSGDLFAFCSDGIEECVNLLDEPFGVKRVLRLLRSIGQVSGQELADRLIGATDLHAGAEKKNIDDRTVVALSVD